MQAKMGVTLKVLDPTPNCPASVVAQQTVRANSSPLCKPLLCCSFCTACSNAAVRGSSLAAQMRDQHYKAFSAALVYWHPAP